MELVQIHLAAFSVFADYPVWQATAHVPLLMLCWLVLRRRRDELSHIDCLGQGATVSCLCSPEMAAIFDSLMLYRAGNPVSLPCPTILG